MKFRFKGLDKYIQKLDNLSNVATIQAVIEKAVDEGSKVVSEYTLKELENIPTDDSYSSRNRIDTLRAKRKGIRTIEKKFLIKEFGTSPIENKRWFINDKTGVARGTLTYEYSNSYLPAVTLARRLENGTSWMEKNPVFSRANRKARKPCLEAIEKSLNKSIESVFNYNKIR